MGRFGSILRGYGSLRERQVARVLVGDGVTAGEGRRRREEQSYDQFAHGVASVTARE